LGVSWLCVSYARSWVHHHLGWSPVGAYGAFRTNGLVEDAIGDCQSTLSMLSTILARSSESRSVPTSPSGWHANTGAPLPRPGTTPSQSHLPLWILCGADLLPKPLVDNENLGPARSRPAPPLASAGLSIIICAPVLGHDTSPLLETCPGKRGATGCAKPSTGHLCCFAAAACGLAVARGIGNKDLVFTAAAAACPRHPRVEAASIAMSTTAKERLM